MKGLRWRQTSPEVKKGSPPLCCCFGVILWGETNVSVLLIMLKPCHFHQLLLRVHYTRETITLSVLF